MAKNKRKKHLTCDSPGSLHKRTKELYLNRPRTTTINLISEETNIPYSWLKSFPKITRPSVNRVEILYNYLAGYELAVL